MGSQPNVELTEADLPRVALEPGPSVKWRSDKPGIPNTPGEVDRGGAFGMTGPDPGWAWKVVARAELPDDDPRLRLVVTGLVMARAAALGRGAVVEDVEAALAYCVPGDDDPEQVERLRHWLEATAHDKRPGAAAASEVDLSLLVQKPERIRWALRRTDSL